MLAHAVVPGLWDAQHRGCSGSVRDPSPLMVYFVVLRACFDYCKGVVSMQRDVVQVLPPCVDYFVMHGVFACMRVCRSPLDSERGVVLNYFDGGYALEFNMPFYSVCSYNFSAMKRPHFNRSVSDCEDRGCGDWTQIFVAFQFAVCYM